MRSEIPTYVMHYTPNTRRKVFLEKQFKIENFENVYWVELYDRENVLYEDFRNHFNVNETEFGHRQPTQFHWGLHKLKPEEVSLCLKQKAALTSFVNSNHEYCLFLEDDVILANDFISKVNYYFERLPEDWEFGFIGQAVDKRIPENELIPETYWYKRFWPADRCADSILIKKTAAKKILDGMNTRGICFPIDHEYAYWFRELNINVYWLEPPLVSQGSQCGVFDSFQDWHSKYHNESFKNIRNDLQELIEYTNAK